MNGRCIHCNSELDWLSDDLGTVYADCENPDCPMAEGDEDLLEVAA